MPAIICLQFRLIQLQQRIGGLHLKKKVRYMEMRMNITRSSRRPT